MPLRDILEKILTDYSKAKTAPLEDHPLAAFFRHDVEGAV
jgi:hypothetical protein